MASSKKEKINFLKFLTLIIGFVLIGLGGVTFLVTTIPGVALIVYALTGEFKFIK